MSRINRLSEALIRLTSDIERKGIHHDYQAGFHNGLTLALHNILGGNGKPRFLYAGPVSEAELKIESCRDGVIGAAQGLVEARIDVAWTEAGPEKEQKIQNAKVAIGNLVVAVEELHAAMLEGERVIEAAEKAKEASPEPVQQELPLEKAPGETTSVPSP